jgi:hypothetical protein
MTNGRKWLTTQLGNQNAELLGHFRALLRTETYLTWAKIHKLRPTVRLLFREYVR